MDELMFVEGLVSEEDLIHYGVPRRSGRYPWGSGENPYHHGSSSPFGRLRERRAAKKKAQVKAQSLEKARQAKADKAEYERKKEEALKTGSAQDILPYLKDLNENELRQAKNRLQLEAEFRQLAIKERSELDPKVAVAMSKIEQTTKYANTAMDAYNAAAKVYNAFSAEKELPLIGSKSRKEITNKKKTNDAVLGKLEAQRQKEVDAAREAGISREKAEFYWEREKKQVKKEDKAAKKAAKKEAEKAAQEQSNNKDSKGKTKKTTVESYVEIVKDIDVVVRPVETRPERMLGVQDNDSKKKKKK